VLTLSVAGCAGFAVASSADAQLSLGIEASSGEKSDFGIGPRAIVDLGPFDAGLRLLGSFDVFFPGQTLLREVAFETGSIDVDLAGDVDYWEANVNLVYTLGLPLVPITPYFGGGLNVARTEVRNSTAGLFDSKRTERGVNVLGGAELSVAGVSPFLEFRYEIQGGEQWVVTGGIVF